MARKPLPRQSQLAPAAVPPGTAPTQDLEGAAEILKAHPQTVADMINDGIIPAARIGRSYVMLTQHLLDHVASEVVRQTAERMRRPLPELGGQA